jgi:hypothetical protein
MRFVRALAAGPPEHSSPAPQSRATVDPLQALQRAAGNVSFARLVAPQSRATVDQLQSLQRTAGNAAVDRLVAVQRNLTKQQQKVLDKAQKRARKQSGKASKALIRKAAEYGISEEDLALIKGHMLNAELTINFASNKIIGAKSVTDLMLESGEIKNRFETGTSGGDADFAGREKVERDLFGYGQIYEDSPMSAKAERPRYAAVNITSSALGATDTSTYGMSSLVLDPRIKQRATLTSGDTFGMKPGDVGTFEDLDHVLLQKLGESDGKRFAETILAQARGQRVDTPGFAYMETQIHGSIDIDRHVVAVRANFNEAFGTKVGESLLELAGKKPVLWCFLKARDEMILQPTVGPPARHFDRLWGEVVQVRADAEEDGRPITSIVPDKRLLVKWDELLEAMPPSNIDVFDTKKRAKLSVFNEAGRQAPLETLEWDEWFAEGKPFEKMVEKAEKETHGTGKEPEKKKKRRKKKGSEKKEVVG